MEYLKSQTISVIPAHHAWFTHQYQFAGPEASRWLQARTCRAIASWKPHRPVSALHDANADAPRSSSLSDSRYIDIRLSLVGKATASCGPRLAILEIELTQMQSNHDYVVVGSGFTALAFIDELLSLEPKARILCIEAGDDNYDSHCQRLFLSSTSDSVLDSSRPDVVPNDFPWQLSNTTTSSASLKACAGTCHLLGGRSNYWYGWCMRPKPQQLSGFPESMLEASRRASFWARADTLLDVLGVQSFAGDASHELQTALDIASCHVEGAVPSIMDVKTALFANGHSGRNSLSRYQTGRRLQQLAFTAVDKGLQIVSGQKVLALSCADDGNHVDFVNTDRGAVHLAEPGVKIILCTGVGEPNLPSDWQISADRV